MGNNEDGTSDDFYDHMAGCTCRRCEAATERWWQNWERAKREAEARAQKDSHTA